ncbi:hypothetical protein jhhlp_001756 [Lomentospora prolificans]|uniref:Amidohydrolase-related domain-containing protein n=1 Tax=Lomentospora prolificans TaxID=41688 RepID=A0A2N3NGL5_9PEZI|nr:hypothetical protein jhhlp_001756 [Lomentospora prolificans]
MVKLVLQPQLEAQDPVRPQSERIFSNAFGLIFQSDHAKESQPQAAANERNLTIIAAELLIPGVGEPIRDAALVIAGGLVAWVGALHGLPSEYADAPHRRVSVPYLMPGLWDCHVHFDGGSPEGNMSNVGVITEHPAAAGARLAKGCWDALQQGYTSMRDLAGYGCELGRAVEDGSIVGPNIYSSGACISQVGGHGDLFELPAGDVLLNLGVSSITPGHYGTGMSIIADGVEECRRAVRLQIRRGARCIKVMGSGGVGSRDDNLFCAQFSPEELECIVKEAARQNISVGVHVHAKAGIINAVNAGVATVEHVTFADDECLSLIKEKGVVYVATRTIVELLLQTGGKGLTPSVWKKAQLAGAKNRSAYEAAVKAGLTFALGTDLSPGSNHAKELEYAVEAGMSNLEAIQAATANGPLTVGAQAPKTGQLKAGYEADIIGVMENPAVDVKILQNRENIRYVWKGGRLFKGPGVGPWGEHF